MAATSSFLSVVSRRLEGKVALITGGASGIGEATAKIFAHHGAKVVIADIQDDLGRSISQNLGQTNCRYVHCDVTDESQVKNAVDKAVESFGKLDIVFNNAGTIEEYKPRIADTDTAEFERVMATNVTGVYLGIKHAARVMVPARRGGSVISTASVSACVGAAGSHAYACSKHAVVGLTRNVAAELGQFGIRVNCVSPFGVATPMAKGFVGLDDGGYEGLMGSVANLKRVTLKAEDIANAALFLASEEGRYVSGHNLLVDGGFTVVNPSFKLFQYPDDQP